MLIVGLISGTSADAIDAALCEISGTANNLQVSLRHALTYDYPAGLQARIHTAANRTASRVPEICKLNRELGQHFADAALAVIQESGLPTGTVDLIGSAGQTIWHEVRDDGNVSSTLQIAEGAEIAQRTGITTINNLRTRDVAVGGHGAPLTSYMDWLLLRHPTHWRAVQNIGGIGNVTFLPPLADAQTQPSAFDTGPGNVLIDCAVNIVTEGQQVYDRDGQLAAQGEVNESWLDELLKHPYYGRTPPKTTGRELFSPQMADALVAQGREHGLSDVDIVATLTALTAATIADSYQRFAPVPISEVILGGGGSHNPSLMKQLQAQLPSVRVRTHEDIGLDTDNKEAMVMAILAHETWHLRPGNLPALTGASMPVIMGQITPGNNYLDLLKRTFCD